MSASSVVEAESSAVSESVPESVAESSTEAQAYVINGVTFIVGDVPNDVTGNWRFATVSEGVDMTQYAVEYYKQCFGDDSEIHLSSMIIVERPPSSPICSEILTFL